MIEAEAVRLRWLADHAPCVDVVTVAAGPGGRPEDPALGWLVTTRPAGEPGDRAERHPRPVEVPAALGRALRLLHRLDPDHCPFERRWDDTVADLAVAAEAGRIDQARLPAPYDRYPPTELVAIARDQAPSAIDPVVGHGDARPRNLHLAAGEIAAYLSVERLGIADRHHDLAVAHRSVLDLYGAEAVVAFHEGYDLDVDLVRLDHYLLIAALEAATGPDPEAT